MYLLLLAVIYIAFISLGLPDSLLGSAWPTMRVDFDVPISYMGIVSMIIAGGTIVSGLMSERLTKKFSARAVTTVSVFLTAIALFGFSTATQFIHLCLWGIPYGLGAGAIDAALNNYVALHYKSKHMSWLHCFWGVGTIISPYVMSYALTHTVWTHGYRTISYIQFGIAVLLVLTLPLWKINKAKDNLEENTRILGIRGALKIRGVPFLLLGFLAYCGAEATTMLWASSYIEGMRGASKEEAAAPAETEAAAPAETEAAAETEEPVEAEAEEAPAKPKTTRTRTKKAKEPEKSENGTLFYVGGFGIGYIHVIIVLGAAAVLTAAVAAVSAIRRKKRETLLSDIRKMASENPEKVADYIKMWLSEG